MHIIGIRKFCCIYETVKEVDSFQLKRSYNPFKTIDDVQRLANVQPGRSPPTSSARSEEGVAAAAAAAATEAERWTTVSDKAGAGAKK